MMKWTFLVFALLGVQLSLAIKAFRGACPKNMTAVGSFDANRYMGKWYTHSKYPSIPAKIARCQSVEFKAVNDSMFIESRQLSSQTNTVKFRRAEIKSVEPQFGRYIQDSTNKAFPEGIQIYVLETDYENFAIRFMCFEASTVVSFHWAVIEFRKRLPNTEMLYRAQEVARINGIIISEMVKIPQEACPSDT